MPNLKEIRARINSVASTGKITTAMKMVSAAKLKKSESMTLNFLPYRNKLSEALSNFLGSLKEEVSIPLASKREVKRVTLIAFSSSSGLCGVYNSNVIKLFKRTYDVFVEQLGEDHVEVILFGKKINDYAKKNGIKVSQIYEGLNDDISFQLAVELSDKMVKQFLDASTDQVVLIYNHYKNAGVQLALCDTILPLETNKASSDMLFDYLIEPSKEEFINTLVPKVIHTKFYSVMLDAFTAEHGARMTAMHIASDNANTLLQELLTQYNKARQNVITTELIDIVGGSEALNR